MARKPMVTRTIVTTEAEVMFLNIAQGVSSKEIVVLPRTYADDKKLLKAVQESNDTEEKKAVHIISKKEVETLYGMSEEDFIKNAAILEDEQRKRAEQKAKSNASTTNAKADKKNK